MTLEEFGAMLATVDPSTRHFASGVRGAYTTWAEYGRTGAHGDGVDVGGWKVQVERYTTSEYDEIARKLYDKLQSLPNVAVDYLIDSETEGESLTIRHLFDCEVW